MKRRKLRIAWSISCGVVCAVLFILFIRSPVWMDGFSLVVSSNRYVVVMSADRRLQVATANFPPGQMRDRWGGCDSRRLKDAGLPLLEETFGYRGALGFGYLRTPLFDTLEVPHWFPAILLATAAFLPWYLPTLRFSLRTLLIATTLVALALGLIVWVLLL